MADDQFAIEWHGSGRAPTQESDPNFPDGIALDVSDKASRTCEARVPWPATEVGFWIVKCRRCRFSVALTAAGRPDDPKSIKLPCRLDS